MSSKPGPGLAMEDLVAVRRYITEDYSLLDGALRALDMEKLNELDAHIRVATFGLAALPSHRGPVFRGAELPEAIVAKYRPGLVIREHGFVCVTANPAVRFPGNATYVIESVNGREVELVADSSVEREVVFFTGTRFAVLGLERDASGEAAIYLRELPDERLLRGDAYTGAADADVLVALRRSRQTREAMAQRLRFAAARPDKYGAPIGIDDEGRYFPVPQGTDSDTT